MFWFPTLAHGRWSHLTALCIWIAAAIAGSAQTESTSSESTSSESTQTASTESELDLVEYAGAMNNRDPWVAPQLYQLSGRIQECDAERLLLLQSDGSPRSIPSPQIVRVRPAWKNAQAAEAHGLLQAKQYRRVVEAVPAALKSGLPVWQQRFLLAELVQAIDALGDKRRAGILFLNLASASPPALLYDRMPLCWTSQEPNSELRAQAREWLASDDDVARLLGASWLLLVDTDSQVARTLSALQSSDNHAVAQLAVAQAWRMVSPPQSMQQLPQWMEFRDKLLPPLQIGPTEFLADRLMRLSETDLAIGQWMRIATLHGGRYHRAAAALESSAQQLTRLGRNEEAQRLDSWIQELRGQ